MGGWKTSRNGWKRLPPLVAAAAALAALSAEATARMSEIDAFQSAVTTQSRQEALAFIADFGSSHLVPDLIELLRPEVAREVCAALGRGAPRAQAACDSAAAAMPTEARQAAPPAPAAEATAAAKAPAAPAPLQASVTAAATSKSPAAGQAAPAVSPAKAQAAKTPATPVPSRAATPAAPAFVIVPGPHFRLTAEPPSAFATLTAGAVPPPAGDTASRPWPAATSSGAAGSTAATLQE
jgi:hypothetical protein